MEGIQIEQLSDITVMRLNRPPANAIDLPYAEAMADVITELEARDRVQALVITGSGTAFSAGLDLKRVPLYNSEEQAALVTALNQLFGGLYGFPRPTVAAINGHAIAGGLILALACDYRVGARGSYQLGLAEVRVGVPYPVAAIGVAQAELSAAMARRLVLTGTNILPDEALQHGILDEIQPAELTLARAQEIAEEMAGLPRQSFARIKRQLRSATLARVEDAICQGKEPMLRDWLSADTASAASRMLRRLSGHDGWT